MRGKTPFWKQGIVLIVILIIGILLGRFVLFNTAQYQAPASEIAIVTSSPTPTIVTSPTTSPKATLKATVAASTNSLNQCIATVTADVKKNNTEYEKGTIVVSFKSGVTFDQAKAVLVKFDSRIENEAQARVNYPSNRIVTAVVTAGQEITKTCQLRQDAVVYYAGLNTILTIHE